MSEPAKRYYKTFSDNMHLQSENARLKAEVERLTKALEEEAACQVGHQENAILIGRLEAEVKRLEAELSNITGWGRGLESDLSWARAELMQVKAEVERLKMSAYNRLSMRIEIDKLNAVIGRLINAGDACANEIENLNEDISRCYPSSEKAIADWNAAKEGKQS